MVLTYLMRSLKSSECFNASVYMKVVTVSLRLEMDGVSGLHG
jgi:hypothetical protein